MDALPHLDEALNELSEGDRTAVLLRYYSGSSYAEIGNRTGRTEEAARKLGYRPKNPMSLGAGELEEVEAFLAAIDAHDDVQEVYVGLAG
mgnify:CR=1 FL=1